MKVGMLILGAVFAALFGAMGRWFGKVRGAKWVNTTGDPTHINMAETLKFLSKFMYALAVVFGGGTILAGITGAADFFYAGLLLSVFVCIGALIYMNMSGRFRL